jgi:cobalt-precorrin 5A hydrolase
MNTPVVSFPVIGIGFRAQASTDEIGDALKNALAIASLHQPERLIRLATPEDKAGAPALADAAARLGLTILPIPQSALKTAAGRCLSRSAMVEAKRGVGSVAEASALAGAGENARLLGPRTVSPNRRVTTAVAVPAARDDNTARLFP